VGEGPLGSLEAAPNEMLLKAPHYSTKGVSAFIRFLDGREGKAIVDGALADAGLPREYVMADDHWVSHEWQERFQMALAGRLFQLTGLPEHDHPLWKLWREGGHEVSAPEELGPLHVVVRTLGAPSLAYRQFPQLMGSYNRTTSIAVEVVGPQALRMTFTPVSAEFSIGPALYWNALGTLERLPSIWGLPDARLEVEQSPFHHQNPSRELVLVVQYPASESFRWIWRVVAGALWLVLGALPGWMWADLPVAMAGGLAALSACQWLLEYRWRHERDAQVRYDGQQLQSLILAQDNRYQKLWDEERKLRRSLLASQKLSGYLPEDLVEEILENPEMETTLGGKRTDAAVLFADLVGFTPRTETRDPEVVVEELNLYFSHIDPAFKRHGGIIDKRMGDGVMVVFVPHGNEPPESVRQRAVRSGLDLLRGLHTCNLALESRGSEPFEARVGIAAGPLVQGTMGSAAKFEYTVIGDVVNTAARLEGQARPGHLMVGADVFDLMMDGGVVPGRVVDRRFVQLKGKVESIEVVELVPLDDEWSDV